MQNPVSLSKDNTNSCILQGILLPKLIPYAQQCGRDYLVQEDGAGAHSPKHQGQVYKLAKVLRLLWPGNSPDLNAIEPCWWWMKWRTTGRGAPQTRKEMVKAWRQSWKDLPQEQIQKWIKAIPEHIKAVIRCEGGNEYPEGSQGFKRCYIGRRLKGKLFAHTYVANTTSQTG